MQTPFQCHHHGPVYKPGKAVWRSPKNVFIPFREISVHLGQSMRKSMRNSTQSFSGCSVATQRSGQTCQCHIFERKKQKEMWSALSSLVLLAPMRGIIHPFMAYLGIIPPFMASLISYFRANRIQSFSSVCREKRENVNQSSFEVAVDHTLL